MARAESAVRPDNKGISIDRMTEHDLLEVVEIEESSGLSPWGWDAYHTELQTQARIMLVARVGWNEAELADGRRIAGYVVARLVGDGLHISNVAVRREYRRCGIGSALLNAALAQGCRRGSVRALLEVRAGNLAAQRLYWSCGFRVAGRRRDYYSAPQEDALIMSAALKAANE